MSKGIIPDINELLALRHYAGSIQFFNRQKVNTPQTGTRLSQARGRGMDFEEVRQYQSGDDVRLIHWSLTARLGKPYTKVYREERERAIYLVLDQSTSMKFGTRVSFKNVLAAKVAALLGWAALQNHEQIGGIVFNDNAAEFIKPKRSRQSLLDMFNLMTNSNALKHYNGGLNNALQFMSKNIQSGSVVIVISDFFNTNEDMQTYLRLIARKCELINVFTYDPLEAKLPDSGRYSFTQDGQQQLAINASKKNNDIYTTPFLKRLELVKQLSQKNRMQFVQLATNDDLVNKINRGVMKYGY